LTGSAAVSPAFYRGDPTVLIGSQTLLQYRYESQLTEPYPAAMTGPLNPAYPPEYPVDPRIFVGGTKIDPQNNDVSGVVHTCRASICTEVLLPGTDLSPQLRVARSGVIAAFDNRNLFLSRNAAATTFRAVDLSLQDEDVKDVATVGRRTILVSTASVKSGNGRLLISRDRGSSWQSAASPLFKKGARAIAVAGGRLVVALHGSGLACSTDGGDTWNRRCRRAA